ncbi:uncharacterized protein [Drosophila bipectinata]|uniref:uncharacterized protein isoform X2 n=1 Tax=Drosophila bipectinata TaxID=42026 RepID=UPI001C8A561A|nr:uncharacterized protein LOC108124874 isoform X2 [Drosophila bipectinata]
MSQPDNAEREQTAAVAMPEACQGCRGQLPRATPVEVEDMASPPLEKLIRKAQMAQKMLSDVMEQLQKQQQQESPSKKSKSKQHRSEGAPVRGIAIVS